MGHRRQLTISWFCIWCTLAGCLPASSLAGTDGISVEQAIQSQTFSDPSGRRSNSECKISPNGKYWFFVTTTGDLATNKLLSKVWIVDRERVAKYLDSGTERAPLPEPLVEMEATPTVLQLEPYGSIITDAHWSSDSSAVLFLGEHSSFRSLYRVQLQTLDRATVPPYSQDIKTLQKSGARSSTLLGYIPSTRRQSVTRKLKSLNKF